jgi:hypothetical protein
VSFLHRCHFCRRVIWWLFGLRIFRGSTGWHVAHRSCWVARARQRPGSVYFSYDISRATRLVPQEVDALLKVRDRKRRG